MAIRITTTKLKQVIHNTDDITIVFEPTPANKKFFTENFDLSTDALYQLNKNDPYVRFDFSDGEVYDVGSHNLEFYLQNYSNCIFDIHNLTTVFTHKPH